MKKRQKSRLTMYIIGGISAISLGSVGFASWVIQGISSTDSSNITASVGSLSDTSVSGSITSSTQDLTVAFDNVSTGNVQLQNKDGKTEKLYFNLKFEFTASSIDSLKGIKRLHFDFTPSTSFYALQSSTPESDYIHFPFESSKKSITCPVTINDSSVTDIAAGSFTRIYNNLDNAGNTFVEYVSGTVDTSTSTKKVSFDIKFSFKWGAAFANMNPGLVPSGTLSLATLKTRIENFQKAFSTAQAGGTLMSVVVRPSTNATVE